jgi:hypothetical protein
MADLTFKAGCEAYKIGNYGVALKEFLPLANRGMAEAQSLLGIMYRNGEGVATNLEESARLTRLAAEQGIVEAQFYLGVMYGDGTGVARDISEAVRWYRLAGQWGCAEAQYNLGCCFHQGRGVQQDETVATWWISVAADQGYTEAQYSLGFRYLNGIGVAKNEMEAYLRLSLASTNGSADAMRYRDTIAQNWKPDQIADAQRLAREWKPTTRAESSLEIFKIARSQCFKAIKEALGEKRVLNLKATDREIADPGKLLLKETSGVTPVALNKSIRDRLTEIERRLDSDAASDQESHVPLRMSPMEVIEFIRRIDDLIDVGTVMGADEEILDHLKNIHLSMIRELEEIVAPDLIEVLLKRYSLRELLRGPVIGKHSELHRVALPFLS